MGSNSHNFFDEPEPSLPPIPNGDVLRDTAGSSGEPQKRRRSRRAVVEFPGYDDELKEGTQLSNTVSKRTSQKTPRNHPEILKPQDLVTPEIGPETVRTRRVRSQFLDLDRGVVVNLSGVNDDIVALSTQDLKDAIGRDTALGQQNPPNRASDKIYVERKGKFHALSKLPSGWTESEAKDAVKSDAEADSNLTHVMNNYRFARHMFLFAHGLLSGLALFHCISVFVTTPPYQAGWMFFGHMYVPQALVFKTIYQALVTICCVSCLCRIDVVSGINKQFFTKHILSLLATVLYITATVLTHLCDLTVTHLLWEWSASPVNLSVELTDELTRWKVMEVVRTGCVCLGWMAISLAWKRDRMKLDLKKTFAESR